MALKEKLHTLQQTGNKGTVLFFSQVISGYFIVVDGKQRIQEIGSHGQASLMLASWAMQYENYRCKVFAKLAEPAFILPIISGAYSSAPVTQGTSLSPPCPIKACNTAGMPCAHKYTYVMLHILLTPPLSRPYQHTLSTHVSSERRRRHHRHSSGRDRAIRHHGDRHGNYVSRTVRQRLQRVGSHGDPSSILRGPRSTGIRISIRARTTVTKAYTRGWKWVKLVTGGRWEGGESIGWERGSRRGAP